MKRFHLILCSAATAAVLGLAGCQSAEEPAAEEPTPELSRADLAALSPDDLVAALTDILDETEALYAEENTLLEALWQLEVEHGATEPTRTALGMRYSFRFYPPRLPGNISAFGQTDYHSVEEIREIRATAIMGARQSLIEFDLTGPLQRIPSAHDSAERRVASVQAMLDRAQAEIEFEQTGERPSQ